MQDRLAGVEAWGVAVKRRDLRALPVAAGAWFAALICVFVPGSSWWVVACCGAVVLIAAAGHQATRRTGGGAGLIVLLFAAMAAVAVTVALAMPVREQASDWSGRATEVTAEVTSSASIGKDGMLWFDAQTVSVGIRGDPTALSVPVRIGAEPGDGFDLGAGIRIVGEAMATEPGERSALIVFASEAEIVKPASGVFGVAADARQAFVDRSTRLPEPGAGLLPGLAVGDTRAVTPELNDDMRTSGLSHLTAVSGANCAIVVGAVFWLAAWCGAGRAVRVTCAGVGLAGFVILVTPEPSVIRAAVMAGVAMVSVLLGRPSAGAGMLALSVVVILIADPWLASTPGFALSAVACGALILLAPPLAKGLGRWMPGPLALAIAVPAAAQLACGPIIALFAEQQSLVGLVANLLAAPAAPLATVIGLLACLAAPVPVLADLLTASAWLPAAWIAETAHLTAALPFAQVLVVPGLLSAAVVGIVSLAAGIVLTNGLPSIPAARAASGAILAVVLALGCAQVVLRGPLAGATSPEGWTVAACDVGQGDAFVIRSQGSIAVIDTGPDPAPLADCLRGLGVTRIDLLVLTHFDLDHVGGVDAVQGMADVVLHGPAGDSGDQAILQHLVDGGATVTTAYAGLRGQLGGASWRVLWPTRDLRAFPPGNDSSVVVEIGGAEVPRSLFLGDLSAEAQRMLARAAPLSGGYAVVKVAHHGSADQDTQLYADLRPTVALFSAGVGNDYGHPRAETLDLLGATGASVLRTDQQGRLLVGLRDGDLQLWTEKQPP